MRKLQTIAERGFTLVEMLITMGLMSIFMLVLTDIISAVGDVQVESEATSAVSQDGRFILARLSYDIGRASSVTTPGSLGSTTSSLVLVIGGVTYTYALSGGNLQLSVSPNTDNLNGADTTISSFTVQRLGNAGGKETLTVQFTVTSVAVRDSGAEVRTFTTTVGRR